MILILHIFIALSSIILTGLAFFIPTKLKLRMSALFIGLTLVSGTFLVLQTQAPLVQACMTGLIYSGFMVSALISARAKLAAQEI